MIELGTTLAFIIDTGNKDIVIMALLFAAIFAAILLVTALGLIKKIRPGNRFFHKAFLLITIAVFLLGLMSYTSTKPFVCGSCHIMRQAISDLDYTKHSKIGCMACHKKANILGIPIQNLSQARMLIRFAKSAEAKPVSSPISNDICLECHEDIEKGVKRYKRIKVSHKEIIDGKISCTECHDDIAHRNQGIRQAVMERCTNCHDDEIASARCRTCHLDKVKLGILPTGDWSIAHNGNWRKFHGTKGLSACVYCHKKEYCGNCHSTEVPHPDGWSFIHGDEAVRAERDCKVCHKDESSCFACHRVEMPHPSAWLTVHAFKVSIVGDKLCGNCHVKTDCEVCHKKHKKYMVEMKRGIR